jgi:hypothetical protein
MNDLYDADSEVGSKRVRVESALDELDFDMPESSYARPTVAESVVSQSSGAHGIASSALRDTRQSSSGWNVKSEPKDDDAAFVQKSLEPSILGGTRAIVSPVASSPQQRVHRMEHDAMHVVSPKTRALPRMLSFTVERCDLTIQLLRAQR